MRMIRSPTRSMAIASTRDPAGSRATAPVDRPPLPSLHCISNHRVPHPDRPARPAPCAGRTRSPPSPRQLAGRLELGGLAEAQEGCDGLLEEGLEPVGLEV